MLCCSVRCTQHEHSVNIAFSPQHSPFIGDLPIFPDWYSAQALLFSWLQVLHGVRATCFSALIVLFHKQRNKSLAVHLALALSSQLVSFVTACLPWKGGNTSPSKACSHTILLPDSAGKRRPSQALPRTYSWQHTEAWSWDQGCGRLQACVCSGQQCSADANTSSSCWSSREHFQRWGWLWTQRVCPRAVWRNGSVGPKHVVHKGPPHHWLPVSLRCLLHSLVPKHVYSLSITRAM